MSKKPKNKRGVWGWIKKVVLILFIFQLVYLVALKWIDPPITLTQLSSFLKGEGLKRDYVSGEEISYQMKLAVVASEDQLFADHSGFDWKSIEKAMKYNEKKPNRIRGASTISQQVAKNVFLWQGRDWIRKGLEIYFTKMIEWIWGKQRILEVYLNVIEMGPGIFGAEAAAQSYFNRSAKNLNRRQAAMIAAALPNPVKYTVKPLSPFVSVKTGWIMRQMNNLEGDDDIQNIIRPEGPKKTPKKK
jgi:monofunctional glycosyltransferase